LCAQDWPQWRGGERDGAAAAFEAPDAWPSALKQAWTVEVGDGVATPALVGDRLYVFARQGDQEITRCLNAATGEEIWKDAYAAEGASGPASRFAGPRASPAVADGKVVTLGARGTLSCFDAETGKVAWRKEPSGEEWPRFFTSSSPLLVDGLCVVQEGSEQVGGIYAFDLATGETKWQWTGDGTGYSSPVLMTVDGVRQVVAMTAGKIVGVALSDGSLLWETPFEAVRRSYNAATPIVHDQTVIYTGGQRGTFAARIEKAGDAYSVAPLWTNPDQAVQFNTPVLHENLLYGLTADDQLYCLRADTGETAWTAPIEGERGFGSVVAAGPVLMGLTPAAKLVVFQAGADGFQQLAGYTVADSATHAYPVVSGSRIFIKDAKALTLWSLQ
jgi:outer membrane protein assembly factor BamB